MTTAFHRFLPVLALCATAHGAVVFYDAPDIAIPISFEGVYVDFDNYLDPSSYDTNVPGVGSTGALDPTNGDSWDINFFFGGAAIATSNTLQPVTDSPTTNAAVLGLSSGDVVGDTSDFPPGYSGSLGHIGTGSQQWDPAGQRAFVGFVLQAGSFPAGSQPAVPIYGWMNVTLNDNGDPGIIHGWAWDPTGSNVTIPEPGTAVLAVFSLCGILLSRRRR